VYDPISELPRAWSLSYSISNGRWELRNGGTDRTESLVLYYSAGLNASGIGYTTIFTRDDTFSSKCLGAPPTVTLTSSVSLLGCAAPPPPPPPP
jgi:hypothetical protein